MRDEHAADVQTWQSALIDGSFEDASAALEAVVARLERGQLRLEDALAFYEIGVKLAERCESDLANAELRVSRLSATSTSTNQWSLDAPD